MDVEHIIRVAEIPKEAHPLSIWSVDPIAPLAAKWAAIAIVPRSNPRYLLYLLDESGVILEFLQYETMLIALDQARALLRLDGSAWSTCRIETPDSETIEPSLFLRYLAP